MFKNLIKKKIFISVENLNPIPPGVRVGKLKPWF